MRVTDIVDDVDFVIVGRVDVFTVADSSVPAATNVPCTCGFLLVFVAFSLLYT